MCSIYLLCQQLCKELLHCLNKKNPSSSFQGTLCATLRGWVALSRGSSPSFPVLFPIPGAGGEDSPEKCHKCATLSITKSPISLLQGGLRE